MRNRKKSDEQGYNPDPAAGVTILLSPRMTDRILDSGCVGSRIVWVRLVGSVCNMFAIVVYVPGKKDESTLCQRHYKTVKRPANTMDCVILMGDLNCELQRNGSEA